jgi:hypothetical protein
MVNTCTYITTYCTEISGSFVKTVGIKITFSGLNAELGSLKATLES